MHPSVSQNRRIRFIRSSQFIGNANCVAFEPCIGFVHNELLGLWVRISDRRNVPSSALNDRIRLGRQVKTAITINQTPWRKLKNTRSSGESHYGVTGVNPGLCRSMDLDDLPRAALPVPTGCVGFRWSGHMEAIGSQSCVNICPNVRS